MEPAVETPKADAIASGGEVRPDWWSSDCWSTPPELVAALAAEFGPFDLDPCCFAHTAKAPTFYTPTEDGLSRPWHGRVFLNPPYSKPGPWLAKARTETGENRAEVVVALVPAATDTRWFHEQVLDCAELRFLRGRVRFYGWRGTPIVTPKTPSLVAIYRARNLRLSSDPSGQEHGGRK